jgi:hypothetical protein
MCLIIDANMAHKFGEPPHDDVKPVVVWLLGKHKKRLPRAVIGGKLRRELERTGQAILRFLRTLRQAGRLLDIEDRQVDNEQQEVESLLEECEIEGVDDQHVLALARVSGSRLLASGDASTKLHALFKDRRFLNPPGKVYQKAAHEPLLRKAPDCKG